jgi:peptidoglycan/LPS O-acetylase OafA/YrhL
VAGSAEHQAYRATRSFSSLDGLRCFSILAVIWHHAHGGFSTVLASTRGYLGVDMFFVLSGFLIVTLLLRERDRTGTIALSKFYARRTLRIFPLYYAVVLGLALLLALKPSGSMGPHFFAELPYLLTYTSNWIEVTSILAITWSLATEEQFYVCWPPIERYLGRLVPWVWLLFLLLNQAINFRLLDPWLEANLGFRASEREILSSTFTPILLGVGLAHLLHGARGFELVRRLCGFPGAPLVFLGLVFAATSIPAEDIAGLPRLLIQLSMAGFLASVVVRERHALSGLLGLRPFVRLGVISYGMYLLHMFGLHGARIIQGKLGLESLLSCALLCLLLTVLMAELSFRWFEAPILRLKQRFESTR